MNGQRILIPVLFVAVFLATVFLLRDTSAGENGPEHPPGVEETGGRDGSSHAPVSSSVPVVARRSDPAEPAPESGRASGPEAADHGPGRIVGTIASADGPVADFGVRITPPAGRVVKSLRGELEITDLPPGTYQVVVYAENLLAATDRSVQVVPGKTTRMDLELKPGIRPAGRVVDETTSHGVAGVLVDFEGAVKLRTDANGNFQCPHVVPPEALTRVSVDHPDFDRLTYVRPPTMDPTKMILGLTRGNAQLRGRVVNRLGIETPKSVRLRLYLDASNDRVELRREQTIPVTEPFEFRQLHEGFYVLAADFPGTDLPARRKEFLIAYGQSHDVEVVFEPGATMEGHLRSRGLPTRGVKVELLDAKAVTVAGVAADAEGFFRFSGVEPGAYRLKVWLGAPWFNTEPVEVSASDPLKLVEIDCDLQRLKR